MKRLLVLLVILLPVSWFVAGCGAKATPTAPPAKEQQDAMKKAQMEMMKNAAQKK